MDQKPRLFVYDRKEVLILVTLAVLAALFAFTLGVHYSKTGSLKGGLLGQAAPAAVKPKSEEIPDRVQLDQQSRGADLQADGMISEQLYAEVQKSGLKAAKPIQVDLPKQQKLQKEVSPAKETVATKDAVTHTAAATHPPAAEAHLPPLVDTKKEPEQIQALSRRFSEKGRYTLKLGVFDTVSELQSQIDALEALNMEPIARKSGEQSFALFVGAYQSTQDAEKAGKKLERQHVIDSFTISEVPAKKVQRVLRKKKGH